MKVKLLTSIVLGNCLGSYCIGEIVDLEKNLSESLLECGYATKVEEEKVESVIEEEIKEEIKEEKPKTKKTRTPKAKSE